MLKAHTLEIVFESNQTIDFIYPTLLESESDLFLVDCGYADFLPKIEKAANAIGLSLENLTGIILTHHDIDHVGGAFEIKAQYPQAKIYASAIEAKYISGQAKSPRLIQAETIYQTLPEEQKSWGANFIAYLKTIRVVEVDEVLPVDADFSALPGVWVVATPGHTPGHISLYLPDTKILIAADAIVIENEAFKIANPQFALDLAQAFESVKKLQDFDIQTVICYHGGLIQESVTEKLAQLLKSSN